MIRAIRFSCQLDFKIHYVTREGIAEHAELIKNVSQERIRDELIKILLSNKPSEGIFMLSKLGLLQYILPELQACVGFDQHNKHHRKNIFDHILKVLDNTPSVLNVRLASLFHDISKPETFTIGEDGVGHFYSHHKIGADKTREIMKRLKFDNETIDNVCILVYEHMSRFPKIREGSVKKLLRRIGEQNIDDLINLQIADIIGSKPPYDFEDVILLKNELKRIIETKEPISVKQLAVNGHDLIELGIEPSKRMGEILNELLQMVMEHPEANNKEHLLEIVKKGLI
jgi:tRNA nucleotidyltransferase (CCA-adding enzyme)